MLFLQHIYFICLYILFLRKWSKTARQLKFWGQQFQNCPTSVGDDDKNVKSYHTMVGAEHDR